MKVGFSSWNAEIDLPKVLKCKSLNIVNLSKGFEEHFKTLTVTLKDFKNTKKREEMTNMMCGLLIQK